MKDSSITLIPPSLYFPEVEQTSEDGLLCFGGEISPNMVLDALVHGIFPWPVEVGEMNSSTTSDSNVEAGDTTVEQDDFWKHPSVGEKETNRLIGSRGVIGNRDDLLSFDEAGSVLAWWSPDPRAIIDLDSLHIPRRLQRTMKSGKFIVTYDQAFPEVMIGCATACERIVEGTWISEEFFHGYCELFRLGFAHSVECWLIDGRAKGSNQNSDKNLGRKLVGGVYGVAINGFFDGESMFSIETDASKVALFSLLLRLKEHGFKLFDLQILNSHTKSLGGIEIPRDDYLLRLRKALQLPVRF